MRETRQVNAVVNTALLDHRASVEAMLEAPQSSNKAFTHTNGSGVIGGDARGE